MEMPFVSIEKTQKKTPKKSPKKNEMDIKSLAIIHLTNRESRTQVPQLLSHEGPDGESPTLPDKIVRLSYHVT